MPRVKVGAVFLSILLSLGIIFVSAFKSKYFLPLSLLMIVVTMLPMFIRFEKRSVKAEEVILIAVLAAIAAVGRVPFAAIPSVQPTSFVIIMTGIVFGGETGFLVGSIAALASNIFLGQGPWTPWQMFSWGLMGLSVGVLKDTLFMKYRWGKSIFGFIWGFVFGWIMNIWSIAAFAGEVTWKLIMTAYIASFYFDLAHALANVFFIEVFGKRWTKILERIKVKYGILS